jgi:hypothetical protein
MEPPGQKGCSKQVSSAVGAGGNAPRSATVLRTLDELSTNKRIVRASGTDANGRAAMTGAAGGRDDGGGELLVGAPKW